MNLLKLEDSLYLNDLKEIHEEVDRYIEVDGFKRLKEAINNRESFMDNIDVIRFRNSLGSFIRPAIEDISDKDEKIVIIDGFGGLQNTYKNRVLLKNYPLEIVESIIIANYLAKSNSSIICIREDFDYEINILRSIIEILEEKNMLGRKILSSNYNLRLEILPVSGDVLDEEIGSLMSYIEGERGCPKLTGQNIMKLGNKESLVLDLETALDFKYLEKSTNKLSLSVVGDVRESGLYYVDYGSNLREVLEKFIDESILKGVYLGGPLGRALNKDELGFKLDYEGFNNLGFKSSPGELVVLSNDRNILDINKNFIDYLVRKTCGKCTPCREGTKRLEEIYRKILSETGEVLDLIRLKDLSETMTYASFCSFGELGGNIFLNSLRSFPNDFREFVNFDVDEIFKEDENEA